MKKIIIILLIFVLSGCSDLKTQEISEDIWGYDFNVDEFHGAFSTMRDTTLSSEGIYFTMTVNAALIGNSNSANLIGFVPHGSDLFQIVNSNVEARCDVDNPSQCTSFFEMPIRNLKFYNDKLYVVTNVLNEDTNALATELVEMDLDGTNRKQVAVIAEKMPSNGNYTIVFHRGKIYYSYGKTLNILDMETWENEEITLGESIEYLEVVGAHENKLQLYAITFSNNNERYVDPTLYLDIETHDIEIRNDKLPLYIDRNNIFVYYDEMNDSMNLYDERSGKELVLKDETGSAMIMGQHIILFHLSSGQENSDSNEVRLFDLEGNLLDYYDSDVGAIRGFMQVVYGDDIFAYRKVDDMMQFIKIKIQDDKLSDPIVLAEWMGS